MKDKKGKFGVETISQINHLQTRQQICACRFLLAVVCRENVDISEDFKKKAKIRPKPKSFAQELRRIIAMLKNL